MKKDEKKVGFFQSMAMKVLYCVEFTILVTFLLIIFALIPRVKKNLAQNAEDYMFDMAVAYGDLLDQEILLQGTETALAPDELRGIFSKVTIKCADSGYIYITDGSGIMLYHPTAEKVGNSVENVVIKGVVESIQAGKIPDPEIVTYLFKGVNKYAAYTVGEGGSYVLVVTADESEIYSFSNQIVSLAALMGIISLLVCGAIGFFAARIVVKPLKTLNAKVIKMADMDLTGRNEMLALNKHKDEVGQISRSITVLQDKLVETIGGIKEQSRQLNEAAVYLNERARSTANTVSEVEKAVAEVADGATNQAQETQEATGNVIKIGDMVEETAKEAETMHDNAQEMHTAGNEAYDILKDLRKTNEQTAASIDEVYAQTNTTNQSVQKIQEATILITSIAEETNLLSLNASIEAARAGEQGRGFAVVASQIQKLAEQSNESARQIEEIISTLIADSEKAVDTMDVMKEIMLQQNANVEKTDECFGKVMSGIEKSIDGIDRIAGKAEEMDNARVSVIDTVQNLTAVAQENAASTEEMSASVTEITNVVEDISDKAAQLSDIAGRLDAGVGVFKL